MYRTIMTYMTSSKILFDWTFNYILKLIHIIAFLSPSNHQSRSLIKTPVSEKAAALVPVNCSQYWFKRTSHCCLLTDTLHTCILWHGLVHVSYNMMLCLYCRLADACYFNPRKYLAVFVCVWCGDGGMVDRVSPTPGTDSTAVLLHTAEAPTLTRSETLRTSPETHFSRNFYLSSAKCTKTYQLFNICPVNIFRLWPRCRTLVTLCDHPRHPGQCCCVSTIRYVSPWSQWSHIYDVDTHVGVCSCLTSWLQRV